MATAEIICIPVDEARGLLSPVSAHFGRAARFLFVDSGTLVHRSIANEHPDDACDPYRALAHETVDVFIVGGIGSNALEEIRRRNIPVYLADRRGVADALASYIAGKLPRVEPPAPSGDAS